MDDKRVGGNRGNKSVWDSRSTLSQSFSGKELVALNTFCTEQNLSQSRTVITLLNELPAFKNRIKELEESGIFDDTDSKYDAFRKKQNVKKV